MMFCRAVEATEKTFLTNMLVTSSYWGFVKIYTTDAERVELGIVMPHDLETRQQQSQETVTQTHHAVSGGGNPRTLFTFRIKTLFKKKKKKNHVCHTFISQGCRNERHSKERTQTCIFIRFKPSTFKCLRSHLKLQTSPT